MAAAAMHHVLPDVLAHRNTEQDESPQDGSRSEEDRADVARLEADKRPLKPQEISQQPEEKEFGRSRAMRLDDFDLLKTLGTGSHDWNSAARYLVLSQ